MPAMTITVDLSEETYQRLETLPESEKQRVTANALAELVEDYPEPETLSALTESVRQMEAGEFISLEEMDRMVEDSFAKRARERAQTR